MQLQVKVESPSKISRKLTVTVPAAEVSARFERGLNEYQKKAKLKGFRPGQAPIAMIRKMYAEEVKHQVYHDLLDQSYQHALKEQSIRAIGRPMIESPKHQHGAGEHDHAINEGEDFVYSATVEILPELEVKGYEGLSLKREAVSVTDEDVEKIIANLRDSQAQLIPATSGLVGSDGTGSSRPIRMGDFVEMRFEGGFVTPEGLEKKAEMTGNRMVEIGSGSLIPGFEEELIGLRSGESKTFPITFPNDFHDEGFRDKAAQFSVDVLEVKEKKLPDLNDEFAQSVGVSSVSELRVKARESLLKDRTEDSERKIRNDVLATLIEKNPFDCPKALIESQTRSLAQDLAQELRSQRMDDASIQTAIGQELENLTKRAENQVRASLIIEAIAKKEKIEVIEQDLESEMVKMSEAMKVDLERLRSFYKTEAGRRDDLEFRVRQEKTVALLLSKAKIKG